MATGDVNMVSVAFDEAVALVAATPSASNTKREHTLMAGSKTMCTTRELQSNSFVAAVVRPAWSSNKNERLKRTREEA